MITANNNQYYQDTLDHGLDLFYTKLLSFSALKMIV